MRTIIDIPEKDVNALDLLAKKRDLPRAALVREAVEHYLAAAQDATKSNLDKYFGAFKGLDLFEGMDGLAYQKKIRAESGKRDADIDRRLAEARALNDKNQSPYESE